MTGTHFSSTNYSSFVYERDVKCLFSKIYNASDNCSPNIANNAGYHNFIVVYQLLLI